MCCFTRNCAVHPFFSSDKVLHNGSFRTDRSISILFFCPTAVSVRRKSRQDMKFMIQNSAKRSSFGPILSSTMHIKKRCLEIVDGSENSPHKHYARRPLPFRKARQAKKPVHSVLDHSPLYDTRTVGMRHLLAKLIDSGVISENEEVSYLRNKDKSILKQGEITRAGVICKCCKGLFSLSKFEIHAGSGLHRPSANMFLRDGRSLLQCQQANNLSLKNDHINEEKHENVATRTRISSFFIPKTRCIAKLGVAKGNIETLENEPNDLEQLHGYEEDDCCEICGDGGKLMLCDSCPSAFHPSCLNLDSVPDGDWYCSTCRCRKCGLRNEVNKLDTLMISCSQCRTKYHRHCVMDCDLENEMTAPWCCSSTCRNVFHGLQTLVGREILLRSGLRWVLLGSLLKRRVGNQARMNDVERQLTGAYRLLEKCFNPMVDPKSGVDLLSQMIFSRESRFKRLDCRGFYTIVLMKGEQLVSAATVRIHRNLVAEMPLIGTNVRFRNQGMCKALMKALQGLLQKLGVHKLIIPSIQHLVDSWKGSFGFKLIDPDDWLERNSTLNMLPFPGTALLYKSLSQN